MSSVDPKPSVINPSVITHRALQWRHRRGVFLLEKPLAMGILNVTPDSFSDGGRYCSVPAAVECALRLRDSGADIIDIGGESTRPGFTPVSAEEELGRVLPVIAELRKRDSLVVISVDTSKAIVAKAALEAGADIVNDVTGLGDDAMAAVIREYGAGVVIMHNGRLAHGAPPCATPCATLARQVAEELGQRVAFALRSGIAKDSICVDPGFGFGKRDGQNWELLEGLGEIVALGYPVLVGGSRKHFIRAREDAAFAADAIAKGAHIVRVHDF